VTGERAFQEPGWKSNSFAVLRPRLIIALQAYIADVEYKAAAHEAARGRRRRPVDEPRLARLARAKQLLAVLGVARCNGPTVEPPVQRGRSRMRRRDFIAGLGSAAAWPVVVRAQDKPLPVVGWLSSQSADDDYKNRNVPFLQGLKETGYVEGQNVAVEYRRAESQLDRLPVPLSSAATCAALRVMFPPYTGQAAVLFRGASFNEAKRRAYGVSWTKDRTVAERFARNSSELPDGSVILETIAPPAAILAQITYPEPMTDAERQEILREHPYVRFDRSDEYHDEREFLVDRRGLKTVTVLQRLSGAAVELSPSKS
jgi:hypothetical protein